MEIKDIIRNRRLELGLRMEDLAERIGVTKATISRWESGKVTTMKQDKITPLCKALSLDPICFMEGYSSAPAARPLTLEDRERAIKEWLRAIAQAAGNEKALAAIERIKLVESTGELRLEDASDLDNALLQLQATSLLTVLEKARQDGKTTVEWHAPSYSEKPNS